MDAQAQTFRDSLVAAGECGRLIASRDWSSTALGPLEGWTQRLRTVTELVLRSPMPMALLWGEDGVLLYNEAYAGIAGGRHPELLGEKVREAWPEVADFNDKVLTAVLAGRALQFNEQALTLERGGRPEQIYFDLSYSPVIGEDNKPAGVIAIVVETTGRVLAERRNGFLLKLGDGLRSLVDPVQVQETAARVLGEHLGASRVGYAEDTGDGETVVVNRTYTDGVPRMEGLYRYADYGHEMIADLRAGRTAMRDDVQGDPTLTDAEKEAYAALGVGAVLNVPLVKAGKLVAILGVNYQGPHAFPPEEIELTQQVAERTWAAVERARSEAARVESEARFRLMADAVPSIVWVTDAHGRVEFFNKQWFDYTGAEPGPISAAQVGDAYVHPEDAAATMAAFDEARRMAGTFLVEHRIRSKSGEHRWFLVRGEPYRDVKTGEVVRWFGASVDIDDRKTAEARLRELNATLEAEVTARTAERDRIWQLSPDLMLIARADGTMLSANPAWERLLGWPPEWLAGRNAAEIKHADDAERTAAELARLAAGGHRTLNFEDRYRRRDGGWSWISWVIEPEGDLLYCIGRDVTAEKAAAEALSAAEAARREADALYRAYFENTAEALFVVNVLEDGGFTVEDLNPAHQASIGLPLSEVRGRRIDEILPADTAALAIDHYRRVITAGQVYQYRETFELHGRMTHWDTVLVPVRDLEGRIVRLIGSSRDLTRQMAAEELLRQSQKMEAMGQLTGGVAHDFNNLLTPIVGSLDMLQRKGLGGEREQRLIAGAMQSAERARTLVQRLLAFARRQPLQPTAVDVGQLVQGMADLIASTTGPQVKVAVEIADDLPPAKGDPNQLEMALLNLVVNARDAMPDGGTLRISVWADAAAPGNDAKLAPGPYVRLSVADTGLGMDEATLARAVEPFFSTKGIGRGTGLGLSMVHGLASQLGGAVTIQSRRAVGTNVELWLPQSEEALSPAEAGPARAAPAPATLGTALLVDDEELVRMSTADMLADLGYDVVEAGSAEAALALIDGGLTPDLLVTDHLMPGMNGTDLARALRERRPGMPILLISGYAESDGVAPDLPRLTKPFRNEELAARLAQIVGAKIGGRPG